ncbi:hypothetical protein AGR8A_Cc40386 [Agrobacterium fabrum str. J-07]|nr:hypothetical protein AGR8A_Cc40386 [Agrobacterium fabrum str. J-07]
MNYYIYSFVYIIHLEIRICL